MKGSMIIFACLTTIIAFIIAVQFQSLSDPNSRDTRNMGELRQALISEKETRQQLHEELDRQIEILNQLDETEEVEEVMGEVMEKLQEQAGLTEVSGPGIIIEVNVVFDQHYTGGGINSVPAYLLRLLVNELNIQGAEHIAIGNQRIVATTAIREANGRTLVNGNWLSYFPLEIKVIADDPESIHHAMMSSQSSELFSYEYLGFSSTPMDNVTIPAIDKNYRVRFMEPVLEGS
ncbi:DUF881 domain-containing protein [Salipaludibacillus sp. HK11]|uniref:DUF881 domain-containing protein n=1 Tax=Salipaludibacillus sp. HK11 TaxID=3394320 RepID=UPI0039FB9DCB